MTRSIAVPAVQNANARTLAARALVPVLAAAALSVAAPGVADAQQWRAPAGWTSINARQASLDHRIDRAVYTGRLTRRDAIRLKADLKALARLETQYRRGGLTRWERADLDRRFDRLSAQVRPERGPYRRAGRW